MWPTSSIDPDDGPPRSLVQGGPFRFTADTAIPGSKASRSPCRGAFGFSIPSGGKNGFRATHTGTALSRNQPTPTSPAGARSSQPSRHIQTVPPAAARDRPYSPFVSEPVRIRQPRFPKDTSQSGTGRPFQGGGLSPKTHSPFRPGEGAPYRCRPFSPSDAGGVNSAGPFPVARRAGNPFSPARPPRRRNQPHVLSVRASPEGPGVIFPCEVWRLLHLQHL